MSSHAQTCPICNGEGMIKEFTATTGGDYTKTCHGCDGRGWVTVYD